MFGDNYYVGLLGRGVKDFGFEVVYVVVGVGGVYYFDGVVC